MTSPTLKSSKCRPRGWYAMERASYSASQTVSIWWLR